MHQGALSHAYVGTVVCRTYGERGEAPVVLISASTDGPDAARACDADGFIAKPFQLATIQETVARFVGSSS